MSTVNLEGYENIFACESCIEEIEKLYKKSPKDNYNFSVWLDHQLVFLNTHSKFVTVLDQKGRKPHMIFEVLDGTKEHICVIRHNHFIGNPRVLFVVIYSDGEDDSYLLLHAFKELGKADYSKGIKVAQSRLKQIKSELGGI